MAEFRVIPLTYAGTQSPKRRRALKVGEKIARRRIKAKLLQRGFSESRFLKPWPTCLDSPPRRLRWEFDCKLSQRYRRWFSDCAKCFRKSETKFLAKNCIGEIISAWSSKRLILIVLLIVLLISWKQKLPLKCWKMWDSFPGSDFHYLTHKNGGNSRFE